jgi:transglutaminase-like putative cysteine protease
MSVLTRPGGPPGVDRPPGGRDGPGGGGPGRPGPPPGSPRGGSDNGRTGPATARAATSTRAAGGRPVTGPGNDLQTDAIATIALTALTLGAVYSLNRLFVSGSYVGPVVATAIVMHAVAWGCRRQGLRTPAALTVSLASLVLLVAWLVLPETTRYGLPLTGTWRSAVGALRDASTEFHSVVAPAPVTRGFLLATVTAIGALALLADWAAFRTRATLEAVAPSFTLFVFAAALGGHQHRTASVAVELAAILGFVVVHEAVVNRQSSAWFASRTRGAMGSAGQVGAFLGAVALLTGLVVGPLLPGAGSKAVILWRGADRGAGSGTRTIPSPLVDLRTRLVDNPNVEVFTVKSSAPEYWRLTSLDTFNGVEWSSDNSYNTVGHRLGASTPTPGQRIEQDYSITGPISSIWLPAAYEPDRINGISGVSYNADSGSLISTHDTTEGLRYQVSSVISVGQLNPQNLEKAGPIPTSGSLVRYTRLPPIPQDIIDETRRVTTGLTSEYDKAKALQDYFHRAPFVYNDQFTLGDSSNALEQFLFKYHTGYCQQFAGAYAVMARILGLPTRVAVGFSYGEQDGAGLWHVKDTYAHAWPEIYFPGSGWVPFEPTPGRGIPSAQQYTGLPSAEQGSIPQTPGTGTTGAARGAAGATTPSTAFRLPKGEQNQPVGGGPIKLRHSSATRTLGLWLLGLLLLAGLWVVIVGGTSWFLRAARRASVRSFDGRGRGHGPGRWRRGAARPSDDPQGRSRHQRRGGPRWLRWWQPGPGRSLDTAAPVLVAWIDVSELLAWWGVTRALDETYFEFARRAAAQLRLPLGVVPEAAPALLKLATDATAAEYAPSVLTSDTPLRALDAVRTIERALVRAASLKQRLRRVLDPRLVFGQAALRRGRAARAATSLRTEPSGPEGPGESGGPSGSDGPGGPAGRLVGVPVDAV